MSKAQHLSKPRLHNSQGPIFNVVNYTWCDHVGNYMCISSFQAQSKEQHIHKRL